MGAHSNLGPIDPQIYGLPAHGVIEEFERAAEEMAQDRGRIPVWQPVIAKYNPTLIGECQKAIDWSNQMVKDYLLTGMFKDDSDADDKANQIVSILGDHALTLSHDRHISIESARQMGLRVDALEEDDELQEAVLTVHHACTQTMAATPAVKLIENHNGIAFIQGVEVVAAPEMA